MQARIAPNRAKKERPDKLSGRSATNLIYYLILRRVLLGQALIF